jgi:hypothetical protein
MKNTSLMIGVGLIVFALVALMIIFGLTEWLLVIAAVASLVAAVIFIPSYLTKAKEASQSETVDLNNDENEGAAVDALGRMLRVLTLIAFVVTCLAIGAHIGLYLGEAFFDGGVAVKLLSRGLAVVGLALAIVSVKKFFIIQNDTTGMFVTIDQLRSFRGKEQIHWYYDAGTHLCFPWERRLADNNVSLKEATEDMEFTLQLPDGTLKLAGSFRLSPDRNNPVRLLRGAAVVAQDIEDRIVAAAAEHFDDVSLTNALRSRTKLNEALGKIDFKDFQKRFGVMISDVTIAQLLPSEEVQRTMSARSEANAIADGTATLLGFNSKEEMRIALEKKLLTTDDVSRARDRFLAVSGNMDGMNLDRKEYSFNLSGLDPEVVRAFSELMKVPGVQAAVTAYAAQAGNNQPQGNRSSKNQNPRSGKKNPPTQS